MSSSSGSNLELSNAMRVSESEREVSEDDMTFCMSNYTKEAFRTMFMMRSHGMLTDVVLEVKQELFPAHKLVLCAASSYFKAMFTGGLKEATMNHVHLQGVCPSALSRIIYFMYTGHIRVTELTVCQLLPTAVMLQVQCVIDACCAFLERQLEATNAIGIANFAEQHGCMELLKKANHFIETNFTEICQGEEFLQLSAYQLIALIRRDELNVQNETQVYNAVLEWVKYDEENRYCKMEHIICAVRCQFLPPHFLKEQMRNCNVLRKLPACREYLGKIFKDLTLHKRPVIKERKPNMSRKIFIAGGFNVRSLNIVQAYSIDEKVWTTLPSLRLPRSGLGAAYLKGEFYAVGGRNSTKDTAYDSDWVDRFSLTAEQWRTCAPMSVPRTRVAVAVIDEFLYAVGGSVCSEYHNTVEYYDPEKDRWVLVKPMHEKRFGAGVTVVNRLLYVIGGYDGNTRSNTVECYHPENDEWSFLPPMEIGRSGIGVASINQYIYVVGGFDGTRQLANVDRFDTENQVWKSLAPLQVPRSALTLTALEGKLYAIAGFDGTNFLTEIEVYDPENDKWEFGTPLTSGRAGHAAAVVCVHSCTASPLGNADGDNMKTNDDDDNNGNHFDDNKNARIIRRGEGKFRNTHFHTTIGSDCCQNCEGNYIAKNDCLNAKCQRPETSDNSKCILRSIRNLLKYSFTHFVEREHRYCATF